MNPACCTGVKQIATLRPSLEMKVRCDPQRNRHGSLVIAHSDIPPKPRPCGPDRVSLQSRSDSPRFWQGHECTACGKTKVVPARVGTAAPGRPSRAQLGSRLWLHQFWIRDSASYQGIALAMP